jgi:hypothetical protein
MYGDDHDEVILHPYRRSSKGVIDVVEKTLEVENGAQVDIPLGEVVEVEGREWPEEEVREVTPLTVVMTELVDMVDYGRQRLWGRANHDLV